ncbi:MAG: DUF4834 family protein [Marinilabiliaceae bacterium]
MLLKLIVFFIIGYYIFKLAFRFLLPLFVSHQARKMQDKQEKAQRDFVNRRRSEEGKVTIEYDPSQKKKNRGHQKNDDPGQNGEYVDFEEIK